MVGDTPAEAVENFVHPLRRVADCITPAVVFASGWHITDAAHSLAFSDSPRTKLLGTDVWLDFKHSYRVEEIAEGPDRGRFKVRTAAYLYSLRDGNDLELIAFHWHPESEVSTAKAPHIHLPRHNQPFDITDWHIPTTRTSLEEVVELAIVYIVTVSRVTTTFSNGHYNQEKNVARGLQCRL